MGKNDKYKKGGPESAAAPKPQQQQQQQRQQQPQQQQQQQNQQSLRQQPSTSSGGGQKQKFQGGTGQKTQDQARDGSGDQKQGQGQEGGYQQRPPAQQQGGHQQGPQGRPAQGQKGGYQQGGQRQDGGYQQGQGGYQTQSQGQYQYRGPPQQQPSTSSGGGQQQKFQGWTGQKTQDQARDGSCNQQQGQWRPAQGQQRGQQQGRQGQEGGYQQRPPAQQQGGHQQGPQGRPAQGQKGGYQQGGQRQDGGYQQGQGGYQTQSQGQYQSRGPPQQQPSTSSGGGQQQKFQGWTGQKTQDQARDGSGDQQQGQWRPAQGQQRGQQQGRQGQEGGYQQRPPAQQQGGHQQGPQGRPAQGQKGGNQQAQGGYQTQSQGQYQSRGPPQQQQAAPLPLPPQPAGSIKRGTIGRPGQVAINYLDLDMSKMPSVAYHYDVKIMPDRPKKFYRQAFEQFRMDQLGGAILAFDGKASCYSVDKLPLNTQNPEVTVTDCNGRTLRYTIEIKETADSNIDLKSLTTYMKDRIFDKPMRAMQCMEVVLASPCYKKAIRVGRSFFKMSDPGECYDLKDGYEALVGLYQAFMLGDRPFLNVDISHKSFPKPISMIQYLEEFSLNAKINNTTNLDYSRRFLEPFLKGINVVYTPPKSFQSAPRIYRVNGLSRAPANSEVFEHDGKRVTIASYFHSRNYPLKYPQLHCLNVGSSVKSVMLPIELCSIEEGQALNRKDGARQVSEMIRFAATSTNVRKGKIMNLMKFFQHNLDPTISRFGIRIANDFIVVSTRILNPPQVEYHNKKFSLVNKGSWRMDNMQFLQPKNVAHKWTVLYCDSRGGGHKIPYNQVNDFGRKILSQSKAFNISLDSEVSIRPFTDDERSLDTVFADLKRSHYDLAIVIIPQSRISYDTIKQKAELQHGILTQCVKQFTVERKCNDQTIGNILLKINSKLNGINHKIKDDPRLPMLVNTMYMGADVTHPSPDQREIPSVVGVAASHDPYGASYNMQYRLQRGTLEEIEDMYTVTLEHLRVYKEYRKAYPDHILYYRDGVSDGQFPKIKNEELLHIRQACDKVGCKPKICCVIVVKRHHTRFFPSGVETPSNRFNNVDPGTVVDRTIVHPNEMQFFMVSHQAIQGTAKPTRYNVIENTGNLDIDLLQQLTYNLCHMFPRCNRSVSYPAPAYLAHLVAARGRVYLTGTHRFLDLKKEYAKRTIVPEFMKKNPMYFV